MKRKYVTQLNLTLRVYFLYKHYKHLLNFFQVSKDSFLFYLLNSSTNIILNLQKTLPINSISKLANSLSTPISINFFKSNDKKKTFINKSVFAVKDKFLSNLYSFNCSSKQFFFLKKFFKSRLKRIKKYSNNTLRLNQGKLKVINQLRKNHLPFDKAWPIILKLAKTHKSNMYNLSMINVNTVIPKNFKNLVNNYNYKDSFYRSFLSLKTLSLTSYSISVNLKKKIKPLLLTSSENIPTFNFFSLKLNKLTSKNLVFSSKNFKINKFPYKKIFYTHNYNKFFYPLKTLMLANYYSLFSTIRQRPVMRKLTREPKWSFFYKKRLFKSHNRKKKFRFIKRLISKPNLSYLGPKYKINKKKKFWWNDLKANKERLKRFRLLGKALLLKNTVDPFFIKSYTHRQYISPVRWDRFINNKNPLNFKLKSAFDKYSDLGRLNRTKKKYFVNLLSKKNPNFLLLKRETLKFKFKNPEKWKNKTKWFDFYYSEKLPKGIQRQGSTRKGKKSFSFNLEYNVLSFPWRKEYYRRRNHRIVPSRRKGHKNRYLKIRNRHGYSKFLGRNYRIKQQSADASRSYSFSKESNLNLKNHLQTLPQLKKSENFLPFNSLYTSVKLARLFKSSFLNKTRTNLILTLKNKNSNFFIKFFYKNSKIKNFNMRKNSVLLFSKKSYISPSLLQLLFNSRLRYLFKIIHTTGPLSLGFKNRKFNNPFFLKRLKKYNFKRKKLPLFMVKLAKINQLTISYSRSYNYTMIKNANINLKPLLSTNTLSVKTDKPLSLKKLNLFNLNLKYNVLSKITKASYKKFLNRNLLRRFYYLKMTKTTSTIFKQKFFKYRYTLLKLGNLSRKAISMRKKNRPWKVLRRIKRSFGFEQLMFKKPKHKPLFKLKKIKGLKHMIKDYTVSGSRLNKKNSKKKVTNKRTSKFFKNLTSEDFENAGFKVTKKIKPLKVFSLYKKLLTYFPKFRFYKTLKTQGFYRKNMKKKRRKRLNFTRSRRLLNLKKRVFDNNTTKIKVSTNALFSLYFNSLNSNFLNLDRLINLDKSKGSYATILDSTDLSRSSIKKNFNLYQTRFTFKTKLFKTRKLLRRRAKKTYLRSKKILDKTNKLFSRNLILKNITLPKKVIKKPKKPFITLFSKYKVLFNPLIFSYKRSFSKKRFYFFRRKFKHVKRIIFRRGFKAYRLRRLNRQLRPFRNQYYNLKPENNDKKHRRVKNRNIKNYLKKFYSTRKLSRQSRRQSIFFSKDSKRRNFSSNTNQGLNSFKNNISLLKRLLILKKNRYYRSKRSRSRQFFRMNTLSTFLFQKKIKKVFRSKKKLFTSLSQCIFSNLSVTHKRNRPNKVQVINQTILSLKNMYDNNKVIYYSNLLNQRNNKSYTLNLFIYKYLWSNMFVSKYSYEKMFYVNLKSITTFKRFNKFTSRKILEMIPFSFIKNYNKQLKPFKFGFKLSLDSSEKYFITGFFFINYLRITSQYSLFKVLINKTNITKFSSKIWSTLDIVLKKLNFFLNIKPSIFFTDFRKDRDFLINRDELSLYQKQGYLVSRTKTNFVLSSTGFFLLDNPPVYELRAQKSSLSLMVKRYLFWEPNDIKRHILNRVLRRYITIRKPLLNKFWSYNSRPTSLTNNFDDINEAIYDRRYKYLTNKRNTHELRTNIRLSQKYNNNKNSFNTTFSNFFDFTKNKLFNIFNRSSNEDQRFYREKDSRDYWGYILHREIDLRVQKYTGKRARRWKFKPGIQRELRRRRTEYKNHFRLKFFYQHRLTHYLPRFEQIARQAGHYHNHVINQPSFIVSLGDILLYSKFLPDNDSVDMIIKSQAVTINGYFITNPRSSVILNDFIQMIVHAKYYILYKWIINWSFKTVNRIAKMNKRRPVYKKVGLFKKPSRRIPNWIYNYYNKYRFYDIYRYLEVDYFTLSSFVIYDPWQASKKQLHLEPYTNRKFITRLYNWRYIT